MPSFWIAAGLAAFLMGLSKGGIPMVAMLSVPLMAIFMSPVEAAGLLLPLYILADAYALFLFRKTVSWPNLRVLLPGALVGIAAGYLSVSHISADAVKLLVALIGAGFLATLIRARLRATPPEPRSPSLRRGTFWGALAGFTSYLAHAGGPPFQAYILPQKLDKLTFLGTTTIFFAIVNLAKLPPFIAAGQITQTSLSQALLLAPFALLGAFTGATIARRLPEPIFYRLIEIALALLTAKLLFDSLTA